VFDPAPLPFPSDLNRATLEPVVGTLEQTSLADGVADTVERFRRLLADGRLSRPV
jgi:hypothetical protein